jgi:universal stress protein A
MTTPQIKTILVPTDFSEPTRDLLDYAVWLGRTFQARLILLHVLQTMPLAEAVNWLDGVAPPTGEVALWEQVKTASEQQMARLKELYASSGVEIAVQVKEGVPFVEIIRTAEREKADLIVMGSHGRTGVRHLLIGSVAERVVRKASCPVLVLKPPDFSFEMPGEKAKART